MAGGAIALVTRGLGSSFGHTGVGQQLWSHGGWAAALVTRGLGSSFGHTGVGQQLWSHGGWAAADIVTVRHRSLPVSL